MYLLNDTKSFSNTLMECRTKSHVRLPLGADNVTRMALHTTVFMVADAQRTSEFERDQNFNKASL